MKAGTMSTLHNSSPLVQDIRDSWSHKGVEVESVSGNKIRCRMPPYFEGLQEFTQSLAEYGAEVDLETTVSNGSANVVLTVFADSERVDHFYQTSVNAHSAAQFQLKDVIMTFFVALLVILQIVTIVDWHKVGAAFSKITK